jgi:hypothetical protein
MIKCYQNVRKNLLKMFYCEVWKCPRKMEANGQETEWEPKLGFWLDKSSVDQGEQ